MILDSIEDLDCSLLSRDSSLEIRSPFRKCSILEFGFQLHIFLVFQELGCRRRDGRRSGKSFFGSSLFALELDGGLGFLGRFGGSCGFTSSHCYSCVVVDRERLSFEVCQEINFGG